MELETDRMILNSISETDTNFIFSQFSDNTVTKYLYDREPMANIADAEEIIGFYIKSKSIALSRWVLVRKSDKEKMGTCGFHCWNPDENKIDVGYDLKKAYWGNGYMQEAMRAIINRANQDLDIRQIDAHIYAENYQSIALVEKLGFNFSGKEYNEVFREKKYLHKIYSLDCTMM